MESAFVLNRRPYHEHSLLVDLLTEHNGRITCVARVAKRKGKIMRGTIEPFRELVVDWFGRGDVHTLTIAEERRRYAIPTKHLSLGLYFSELVLKLLPQDLPSEEVYSAYQQALYALTMQQPTINIEIQFLASLGLDFISPITHKDNRPIDSHQTYQYTAESGIECVTSTIQGATISGQLLINLYHGVMLDGMQQQQCRQFLDHLIDQQLVGRLLKTRKFAFEY